MTRILHTGVVALMLTVLTVPAAAARSDAPRLVSRADGRSGALANRAALGPNVSGSGRYVTFWSDATNLSRKNQGVAVPTGYLRDTYRHRTFFLAPFTNRVFISAESGHLVWGTGGGDLTDQEIYVKLREKRKVRALPDLVDGLAPARQPYEYHELNSISATGQQVAFVRQAPPAEPELLVADLPSRRLISVTRRLGYAAPHGARLSSDGRFVAFTSETPDLVPGDTNGKPDAFVADLETGAISLVDRTAAGVPGDAGAEVEAIDLFGRYITFSSRSRDLDPAATNGVRQVYMRDMKTGKTTVVSRRSGAHGALGNRDAGASTIFYAGRYIAFATRATNLSHRPCSASNIVVRDMRRLTTRLIQRPERLSRRCSMTAPAFAGGNYRVAFVARGTVHKRTRQVYVARTR
jgi:hypothetical protein